MKSSKWNLLYNAECHRIYQILDELSRSKSKAGHIFSRKKTEFEKKKITEFGKKYNGFYRALDIMLYIQKQKQEKYNY